MESDKQSDHRQLALMVVDKTDDPTRRALEAWLIGLLAIRETNVSAFKKSRLAIQLTAASHVIWPMIKVMAKQAGKMGWTERGWTARAGLVGAGIGLAVFGGQNAGIAALGGAIGVPLWVVLGSGAAFAEILRKEIAQSLRERSDRAATDTILEGEVILGGRSDT